MKNKIVIATNNQGKLRELRSIFNEFQLELITQGELDIHAAAETGDSFLANALQKARHAARYTKYAVIADDSGLMVDALNGEPGIFSARYAKENASDEQNNSYLLEKMFGIENRQARFHCCLVYIRSYKDPEPIVIQAEWRGLICESLSGNKGFGYDPIFFVPELNHTAAELSIDIKNKFSHRGQANRILVKQLLDEKLIVKQK